MLYALVLVAQNGQTLKQAQAQARKRAAEATQAPLCTANTLTTHLKQGGLRSKPRH